jgi:hypothetical protein
MPSLLRLCLVLAAVEIDAFGASTVNQDCYTQDAVSFIAPRPTSAHSLPLFVCVARGLALAPRVRPTCNPIRTPQICTTCAANLWTTACNTNSAATTTSDACIANSAAIIAFLTATQNGASCNTCNTNCCGITLRCTYNAPGSRRKLQGSSASFQKLARVAGRGMPQGSSS